MITFGWNPSYHRLANKQWPLGKAKPEEEMLLSRWWFELKQFQLIFFNFLAIQLGVPIFLSFINHWNTSSIFQQSNWGYILFSKSQKSINILKSGKENLLMRNFIELLPGLALQSANICWRITPDKAILTIRIKHQKMRSIIDQALCKKNIIYKLFYRP